MVATEKLTKLAISRMCHSTVFERGTGHRELGGPPHSPTRRRRHPPPGRVILLGAELPTLLVRTPPPRGPFDVLATRRDPFGFLDLPVALPLRCPFF